MHADRLTLCDQSLRVQAAEPVQEEPAQQEMVGSENEIAHMVDHVIDLEQQLHEEKQSLDRKDTRIAELLGQSDASAAKVADAAARALAAQHAAQEQRERADELEVRFAAEAARADSAEAALAELAASAAVHAAVDAAATEAARQEHEIAQASLAAQGRMSDKVRRPSGGLVLPLLLHSHVH